MIEILNTSSYLFFLILSILLYLCVFSRFLIPSFSGYSEILPIEQINFIQMQYRWYLKIYEMFLKFPLDITYRIIADEKKKQDTRKSITTNNFRKEIGADYQGAVCSDIRFIVNWKIPSVMIVFYSKRYYYVDAHRRSISVIFFTILKQSTRIFSVIENTSNKILDAVRNSTMGKQPIANYYLESRYVIWEKNYFIPYVYNFYGGYSRLKGEHATPSYALCLIKLSFYTPFITVRAVNLHVCPFISLIATGNLSGILNTPFLIIYSSNCARYICKQAL